ncbi:DUF2625 family protein [Clostridium estertheticum]|uniref:DUF2625 family protein n=1 Tax=Clostridium estertheticum TaxID=238834 RepID=UPI001CF58CED|nr:DUF2625 family protein [Clostridium estertheticum]MCB2357285.1 DUF2625 domain-containing protein [Clostridium estertheticum]WAG43351.1 DUF2625 domain-containing protein [Clostridium estertheticum]
MSNIDNSLWEELNKIFSDSNKNIKLNMYKTSIGQYTLDMLKITSKSALGSIIFNTSGLTIDNWIRILGSENKENRGILSYNKINEQGVSNSINKMLIVGDDVIGGIFALNAGKFANKIGDVWYFAPDTLEWESLELKYSEFITWIALGNTDELYSTLKWSKWQDDVSNVKFDEAILVYPFLWSNEIEIEKAEKKLVPVEELLNINLEYSKKFNLS